MAPPAHAARRHAASSPSTCARTSRVAISISDSTSSIFTGYAIGVETVFDWPGVGKLAVDAVFNRDVVLVSAIVLFTGALVVVANAVVDAIQALVDKRVAV